jgi:hypothetical protein
MTGSGLDWFRVLGRIEDINKVNGSAVLKDGPDRTVPFGSAGGSIMGEKARFCSLTTQMDLFNGAGSTPAPHQLPNPRFRIERSFAGILVVSVSPFIRASGRRGRSGNPSA